MKGSVSAIIWLVLISMCACQPMQRDPVSACLLPISESMKKELSVAASLRKESQQKGFEAYLHVLQKAKEEADYAACIEAYRRLIFISGVYLYKTDTAVILAKEAIDMGQMNKDVNTLCEMYGLMGVAYQVAGNIDSAVVANKEALKYMALDESPDSLKNYPLYLNVADLYSTLGNQLLAIEYTQKYLDEYVLKINDTVRMISSYNNLSIYHTYNSDTAMAEKNAYRAYHLLLQKRDIQDMAYVYSNMFALHNNKAQSDSALYFCRLFLDEANKMGDIVLQAKALGNLFEIPVQSKDTALAKQLLAQYHVQSVLENQQLPLKVRTHLMEQLYRNYKLLGQDKKAFAYIQKAYDLFKKLKEQESNDELIKFEFEQRRIKHENDLLSKQLQIKKQNNVILLLIFIVFVAVAIVFGIAMRQRRKRILHQKEIELIRKQNEWEKEKAQLTGQLKERNRISGELHDDLGATLTSIVLRGEMLKRKVPDIKEEINVITSSANDMADNLNDIVWSLNSRNDSLQGLIAYIRKFATGFCDQANIGVEINDAIAAQDIVVDSLVRRAYYLSSKECIHNIVKHSHATKMWMDFKLDDDRLHITIKDNGTGMGSAKNQFGNGMANIRRNMEQINGHVDIRSSDSGTEIVLLGPLVPQ